MNETQNYLRHLGSTHTNIQQRKNNFLNTTLKFIDDNNKVYFFILFIYLHLCWWMQYDGIHLVMSKSL